MGNEPSALGALIAICIYTVVGALLLFFFVSPIYALIPPLILLTLFVGALGYDSRNWGNPELNTHGVQLTSQTRKLKLDNCEVQGMVMGSCVKARNMFSAARAEARSLIGGEARQFTQLVDESRNIAISRMCQKARAMGCNAVIGYRMVSAESMWGATEIIAYGTAVKVSK